MSLIAITCVHVIVGMHNTVQSEDMPEGKHGPYISAPTLQEHISISIDEETDDMELQDLSVPREKDPQGKSGGMQVDVDGVHLQYCVYIICVGSLATVSGKETFPRVPSSSNIQSYLNKPPLNGICTCTCTCTYLESYRSAFVLCTCAYI